MYTYQSAPVNPSQYLWFQQANGQMPRGFTPNNMQFPGFGDMQGNDVLMQGATMAQTGEDNIRRSGVEAGRGEQLQAQGQQNLAAAQQLERNASTRESSAQMLEQQAASARTAAGSEANRAADLEARARALRAEAAQARQNAQQHAQNGQRLIDLGQRNQRDGERSMQDGRGHYFGIFNSDQMINSGRDLRDAGRRAEGLGQQRVLQGVQENGRANNLEAQAAQLELEASRARGQSVALRMQADNLNGQATVVHQMAAQDRQQGQELRGGAEADLQRGRQLIDSALRRREEGQLQLRNGYEQARQGLQMRQSAFLGGNFETSFVPMFHPLRLDLPTYEPPSTRTYDRQGHQKVQYEETDVDNVA
ncbi:MAG: hypothetical protein FJX76_05890 [Armatimonadetes bacterium]|nr:hypothetical protein [Armatimonadota bacterium]